LFSVAHFHSIIVSYDDDDPPPLLRNPQSLDTPSLVRSHPLTLANDRRHGGEMHDDAWVSWGKGKKKKKKKKNVKKKKKKKERLSTYAQGSPQSLASPPSDPTTYVGQSSNKAR
jgi:hypothetical protein